MSDRVLNRCERRSAGAALLASIVVHLGLLVALWWCVPESSRQELPHTRIEAVVLVVEPSCAGAGSSLEAVTLTPVEPVQFSPSKPPSPFPRTFEPKVVEDPPAPVEEHSSEAVARSPSGDHSGLIAPFREDTSSTTGSTVGTGGPSLFQVSATGRSVVYVLDRSMSMGLHDGLRQARAELAASLNRLPPSTPFQVIAYNHLAEPFNVRNYAGLLTADRETIDEVTRQVTALVPTGRTYYVPALRRGLEFQTDVLFFITDADELTVNDVAVITAFNGGRCAIHVIDLSNRSEEGDSALRQLAARNRGTYRRVAVKVF